MKVIKRWHLPGWRWSIGDTYLDEGDQKVTPTWMRVIIRWHLPGWRWSSGDTLIQAGSNHRTWCTLHITQVEVQPDTIHRSPWSAHTLYTPVTGTTQQYVHATSNTHTPHNTAISAYIYIYVCPSWMAEETHCTSGQCFLVEAVDSSRKCPTFSAMTRMNLNAMLTPTSTVKTSHWHDTRTFFFADQIC